MNRILFAILFYLLVGQDCVAQDGGTVLSHYIFDHFTKGTVRLKSGSVTEEELNYNSLTSEMVFNSNGSYLAIDRPADVDTIIIAGRAFVPVEKKFYEVLVQGAAPLYEEYTCTIKDPGSEIGYGMASTTSATTQLKSLIQSGGAYALKLPDGFQPVPQHSFYILRDGKFKPANNARQLNAVFPEKKAIITQYIKEKHPDLSRKEDLTALVKELE